MRLLALAALAAGANFAACSRPVERAPALLKQPDAPAKPPQKSFLTKAADSTWGVVSAPVRWVTPNRLNKVAPAEEPESYEPADMIIMQPGGAARWNGVSTAAPAATQAAATQTK